MISPQNLGDSAVELLSYTNLRHLHIIQNRFTPNDSSIKPVSYKTWRECKKYNSKLCVHLQVEGTTEKEVIWQHCAPVRTILYESSNVKVGDSN